MGRALLVDATAVFAFQQHLKQQGYPIQSNINYGALLEALRGPAVIRVNQLAKELGISIQVILDKCRQEGLADKVPNHMSTVSAGLAETIREWFGSSSRFELM